jgi:hypothetical protein
LVLDPVRRDGLSRASAPDQAHQEGGPVSVYIVELFCPAGSKCRLAFDNGPIYPRQPDEDDARWAWALAQHDGQVAGFRLAAGAAAGIACWWVCPFAGMRHGAVVAESVTLAI